MSSCSFSAPQDDPHTHRPQTGQSQVSVNMQAAVHRIGSCAMPHWKKFKHNLFVFAIKIAVYIDENVDSYIFLINNRKEQHKLENSMKTET